MGAAKAYQVPPKIIVIGGSNRDIISRIHSETADFDTSNQGTISQHDGGVARNIAEVLGRLEISVSLITAFGDDDISNEMMTHLNNKNVDLTHAIITSNMRSDTFIAVHDHKGETIACVNQMVLVKAITPTYIQSKVDLIEQADFVICDSNLDEETLAKIASLNRKGKLVIDAVSTSKALKLRRLLAEIDILKLSRSEGLALCNLDKNSSVKNIIMSLYEKGVKQILVSDGARGFMVNSRDKIHHFAAIESSPQTVTGAGDCLLSGYLYGLFREHSMVHACELGRQTAYLSTRSVSAVNDYIYPDNINEVCNPK